MAERNEMMQQNQKQNIEQKYYYTVMEEQEGMRLDQFLAGELKEHSRSYIQKLIKEGRVTVGDKKEKPGCRLKVEDSVVICVPPLKELEVLPEKMDLDIIYEDEDVILINKPKDMVVHPCPGRYTGTLVNGLLYHCRIIFPELTGYFVRELSIVLIKIRQGFLLYVRMIWRIKVWQSS